MRTVNGGIDVLGWVNAAEPPNMDIPRKENPRRIVAETSSCSVRSAYCGTKTVRLPDIRLANSCGSLANCTDEEIRTHIDQFKLREAKKKDKRTKKERSEQRIIDLLTVKAAWNVLRESCFYWGNISGDRAREVLKKTQPGTFLIRDSSDKRYLFSLSVMTIRGPTSIRLIFSRGCFRVETTGIISPRSPCVVSLIVRMAYLSKNSVQNAPIAESEELESNNDEANSSNLSVKINDSVPAVKIAKKIALLERPLLAKVPRLKHIARVAVNKHNLRAIANKQLTEFIQQYPYPI